MLMESSFCRCCAVIVGLTANHNQELGLKSRNQSHKQAFSLSLLKVVTGTDTVIPPAVEVKKLLSTFVQVTGTYSFNG